MEPVFTIPYSEYRAIDIFAKLFKKSDGYSILIPTSRQQKGIDFAIIKFTPNGTRCITAQVKGSRAYFPKEPVRKTKIERHKYTLWFNVFEPPQEADIVILMGLYPEHIKGNKVNNIPWKPICLMFTKEEISKFMASLKTKSGKKESKFIFGFNSPDTVFLRRGTQDGHLVDYSAHLVQKRVKLIKQLFP